MTAEDLKLTLDAELSRVKRMTGVANIALTVNYDNGEKTVIRLTSTNSWFKAPEILNGLIKVSGVENSVNSDRPEPTDDGIVTRTRWNRTIYYLIPEKVQGLNYMFDIVQEQVIPTPEPEPEETEVTE